jgi:hypothetical protein
MTTTAATFRDLESSGTGTGAWLSKIGETRVGP